jgi:hypothetical protein
VTRERSVAGSAEGRLTGERMCDAGGAW